MNLPDLIDLEVQLLRDEQDTESQPATDPAIRDRGIGLRIADQLGVSAAEMTPRLAQERGLRHRVCAAWLAELPKATRALLPGRRLVHRYRVLGWILCALVFVSGVGTALAALHATEEQPINVLVFIVLFFVLQIFLLALYPLALLVRRLRGDGGGLPWLQALVVRIGRLRWLDRWTGGSSADLPDAMQQLRLRNNIYGRVLQWNLFSLVQRVGTAFNAGALLTTLYMVAFHDLALCCWSTTLEIASQDLNRGLQWMGWPWAFLPFGDVPSPEAVEYSRWVSDANSGYLPVPEGVNAPALRRTWWPYLIAGLLCWGLLPRAIAATCGRMLGRAESGRVPLTHRAVQSLFERLYPPTTNWSGPAPEAIRGPAPVTPVSPPRQAPAKTSASAPTAKTHLVCWGSLHDEAQAALDHLARRFQRPIEDPLGAGLAEFEAEQRSVDSLNRAKARRVIVALPEGQQPTKDVMRFFATLRAVLTSEAELIVCLLAVKDSGYGDVDPDERDAWQQRLLAEADPYLSLQTVGVSG